VQQASGLDSQQARKLLMMLSPIVLGVLARKQFGGQNAANSSPANLRATLENEGATASQQIRAQAPGVANVLGGLFS
jgi:hypothetical protein